MGNTKFYPPHIDVETILESQKLRIVILDCAYDTLQNEQTKNLISEIAALKIRGYRAEYPYGVLPLDATDFVGTHVLLCKENGLNLNPIMGFKSMSYSRCQEFKLPFPAFNLIYGQYLPEHELALKSLVATALNRGEEIAYNSAWTIDPDIRHERDLKLICRNIAIFFLIRYYEVYQIPNVVAGAVVQFNVQEYKEFVGYKYLTLGDRPLAPIPFFYANNEPVAIMYMEGIRSEALEWAHVFDRLWDARLTIAIPHERLAEKKAA